MSVCMFYLLVRLTNVCSPSEARVPLLTQRELFAHFNLP